MRVRDIDRYRGEKPANYFMGAIGFAGLTISSMIAYFLFGGLFFFGFILFGSLTIGMFYLFESVLDTKLIYAAEQKKPAHQLTKPLHEGLTKHNQAVETVTQTITLQKSFNDGKDDARFFDLIEKVVTKIENNARVLKQRTELYVAVTETPDSVYSDFGKVIAGDLAMPGELDNALLVDLGDMRQRMETQVVLPELSEVLECREFLAIKS